MLLPEKKKRKKNTQIEDEEADGFLNEKEKL